MAKPEHSTYDLDIRWVNILDFVTELSYNRGLRERKVQEIMEDFDQKAAGVLIGSERENKKIYLIDGHHRRFAMIKLKINKAKCEVLHGLSEAQEAEIFHRTNKARGTITPAESFKSGVVAGLPNYVAINGVLAKYGLDPTPGYSSHAAGPRSIRAIGALLTIHAARGLEILDQTIELATDSWPEQKRAREGRFLLGLSAFLAHYSSHERFRREHAFKRFQAEQAETIFGQGKGDAPIFKTNVPGGIERRLVLAYNKNTQEHNRLPLPDYQQDEAA